MRSAIVLTLVLAAGCDAPKEPRTSSKTNAVEASSWPTAIDTVALSTLDQESRSAVGRSPVPVLVPKRPELLRAGKVMAEENWSAFNASHDGLTVNVSASRIEQQHKDIPAQKGKHVIRGANGWITKNESIWSATWRELGIWYSLDVECGEPTDKRCDSDTIITSLASDLVFVGGKGGAK